MEAIVKILSIRQVTHDVREFRVEKPKGYRFIPGQATDVSINRPEWKEQKNPFTFTGLNDDAFLEFTIKRYPDHHAVTDLLHQLKTGDEIIVRDVWGAIEYQGPGIFLAGGAGIDQQAPLQAWAAREQVAQAALEQARAARQPDWSVSASYGKRAPGLSDMVMLEVGVSLPLFTRNRQDRGISARQAQWDAVQADHEDARRAQREAVTRAVATWSGWGRQIARYQQTLLPLARDRAQTALAGYRGGGSLQPWLDARRAEIELVVGQHRESSGIGTRHHGFDVEVTALHRQHQVLGNGRVRSHHVHVDAELPRHHAARIANALHAVERITDRQRMEHRAARRVENLLDLLGVAELADTFVDELSTGSKRLVELACMMALEPTVLLLDEPSSGLAQAEIEVLGPVIQRIAAQAGCGLVQQH